MHAATGIGRRIAFWRTRRGLTQADFARLMDRSVRWVEDIEAGHRQADPRLSVLARTCDVLHIGLDRLVPDAPRGHGAPWPDPLPGVRAALRRADIAMAAPGAAPDLPVLRRELAYGWTAYDAGDYLCLDRVVAPVLAATPTPSTRVRPDTGERPFATAAVRSDAFALASAAATVFGDTGLAWRAADRALTAAGHSGDAVVIAHAAHRSTVAMIAHEGEAAAAEFAAEADASLADAAGRRGAAGRAALRTLRLGAALATARLGDSAATRELLDAAERVDPGAVHVGLHRVAAHVLLGDYPRAIAGRMTPDTLAVLPRGRQARHLLDIARALSGVGRRGEAVLALLDAEAVAAQEIRCRPARRRFVEDLLRLDVSADGDDARLRALASRCLINGSGPDDRVSIM